MTKTTLETEIWQQPEALEELLEAERAAVARVALDLAKHRVSYILMAARGSSDNAARYAQYLFGFFNRIPVALAVPSLYTLYDSPPNMSGALVIGISQSGRSPDIVAVLEAARVQGCPTLAITNDTTSALARAATSVLQLRTGVERAVAATKTYTNSLALLAMLSATMAGDDKRLSELQRVPALMRGTLQGLQPVMPSFERYQYLQHCAVLGRGFNYATVFEVALKIKELTGVTAEAYSSADFLHGPISIVGRGFPLLLIAPDGSTLSTLKDLAQLSRERGADLLVIASDRELLAQAQTPLRLPGDLPEWLSPMIATLPGQVFAMNLARLKGHDIDHPVGLEKVTETY
jgi:glucosamine--fructose-6-phosphate aminotransferase (isomerizing)